MCRENKETEYYIYRPTCWFSKYLLEIIISVMGIIIIHAFLLADTFQGNNIDSEKASSFGDFVGGYIGSFFSLVSIILLFITLKNQRDNFSLEKFENKLFQMIGHHEHSIEEIGYGDLCGKRTFVWMIREYRLIHKILKYTIKRYDKLLSNNAKSKLNNNRDFMAFSYLFFFFGVGGNSSRILKSYLVKDYEISNDCADCLIDFLNKSRFQFKKKLNFPFIPFEGHQSRLGDYYRYLFQIVKYVDSSKLDINKYEYIKIIRAQLSNHEQALLLINSFSSLGDDWWKKNNYIKTYKFVSNIPNAFFNPENEINLTTIFNKGYFEFEKDYV